jgi:hypothetical protein
MCNAWNHSADCACGFGPPYPFKGDLELAERQDWLSASLRNRRAFLSGMIESGFPASAISQKKVRYDQLQNELTTHKLTASRARSVIYSWITKNRKEIEVEYCEISIPIFKLHLPPTKGSRVTYSEDQGIEGDHNWSLKVFGSGLGANQTINVSSSLSFVAEKGKCQAAFLPVPMKITHVCFYKGDKIKKYYKIEVDPERSKVHFNKGLKLCSKKDCKQDLESAESVREIFPLREASRTSSATYTRQLAYEGKKELEVGIKPFQQIGSTVKVSIKRLKKVGLKFELPGGYDYYLRPLRRTHGIVWQVESLDTSNPDSSH